MMMKSRFVTWLRSFRDDTRGVAALEFILVMPFLFWAFMAIYVYFDGYRQSTVNLKAAYTISDLISRETEGITSEYIDSMYDLHQLLTRAESPTTLRITVVRWNNKKQIYRRDWSQARGGIEPLKNSDMEEIEHLLPTMPHNERVILVETSNTFVPVFGGVGMGNVELENFVFTRPRFAPQVCWISCES